MSKVGRNDPCPCGSGKKYKKCCWKKDQEASHQRFKATSGLAGAMGGVGKLLSQAADISTLKNRIKKMGDQPLKKGSSSVEKLNEKIVNAVDDYAKEEPKKEEEESSKE